MDFRPFDLLRIHDALRKFDDWRFKKKWNKLQQYSIIARRSQSLCQFLQNLYDTYELLHVKETGHVYPVIAFEAKEKQWSEYESVLGKFLLDKKINRFALNDEKYLKQLTRVGRELFDRGTYTMEKLETQDGLTIQACKGTYFDAVTTSHVLSWELLTKFGKSKPKPDEVDFFLDKTPLRKTLHDAVLDPVVDGSGRSNAIGGSMLIIYKDVGGMHYRLLINERSKTVAADIDMFHVVPSFMVQPMAGDWMNEFSVEHQVFREYLEEVFNIEEVRKPPSTPSFDYFYKNPNLMYLKELLSDTSKARLMFTGVAVDLFNLRPEICTLLLIETSDWAKNHSQGNAARNLKTIEINNEFKTPDEMHALRKDYILSVDLEGSDLKLPGRILEAMKPESITAPGVAALHLGLKVAREVLN